MLACNCLNITIEFERNDDTVAKELLHDENCDFLDQNDWLVGRLVSIKKLYAGLVFNYSIGLWTISRCINCNIQTYAIHRDRGTSCGLINSKLQNEEAINNIKSSNLFSNIFQIVVNPIDIGADNAGVDTYLTKDVGNILESINDVVTNYIRKEEVSVEEKIRKFTEEEYERLNDAKNKAFKERAALVRIIQNAAKEANICKSPKSLKSSGLFSPANCSIPSSPVHIPFSPKRPKGIDSFPKSNQDYRDDLQFNFESEEYTIEGDSFRNRNLDDSESDEVEEAEDVVNEAAGISIFQGKHSRSSGSLAKSCPVDIPTFSPVSRTKNSRGDDDSDFSPNNEIDIAASIKALARSVHGDTIFGELPQPRFSTQI
ncbi:uncharacterized protein LOC115876967 [Sitophilus oryzae]|uniref:Uncharacterized protein LOC115876967 n=1 Tax=Sitophilus oryzae TaxID=7048 RepID=A0A6J2XD40_SITOR|nr:uncharacterized protein LOC115876967 [Sitophilus oryzae]XP_030748875.1 uncharacterized protein LOC115876967 [Sitophilus oryzae]